MKMDKELEILNTINAVEAPPFLYTRIEQRIRNRKAEVITPRLTYIISACVVLLIAFNTFSVYNAYRQTKPKTDLTKSMNLIQDNYLYK